MESDFSFVEDTVDQFFSERSAVKLAFNEGGSVVNEQVGLHGAIGTAQALLLLDLPVPNTLTTGANAGLLLDVDAAVVVGNIAMAGELDFYSFMGQAGDLIYIEVMSDSLNRIINSIDTEVSVFDSLGMLVDYYGVDAVNDDEYETFDSIFLDLVLPSDGTYFIQVGASPFVASDTGNYELFIHEFATAAPVPEP
ncbi:MAG: hypothetical protein N2C14_22090, partial [Planctomycetales bacterium]